MTDQIQVARSSFITDLLAEADQCDENIFPPPAKAETGEHVFGEVSPWLRKVFALTRYYLRECKRLRVEMEFQGGEPDHVICERYSEMDSKHEVLDKIFWASLRSELRLHHEEVVGVREGWTVVRGKPKPKNTFKEFLGGMIGGSITPEE